MRLTAQPWMGACLIGLLFVLLQSWDISTYPLVGTDEAFLNDAGLQLEQHGQFRSDVFKALPGYGNFYFWQPPGLALSAALSYRLFGFGIWQTRLPSIFFGGVTTALVFLWVKKLSGQAWIGTLAALGLFCLPDFIVTTKMARMDTGSIAFLLMATLLLIRPAGENEDAPLYSKFAAGLCVGIAGMFHAASMPWVLGLLMVMGIYSPSRWWSLLCFAGGAALPVLPWAFLALRDPDEFRAQFIVQVINRTAHEAVWRRFYEEALRYLHEFSRLPFFPAFLAVVIVMAIVCCAWEHRLFAKLFVLTGTTLFFNALLTAKSSGYYTVYPKILLLCTGMVLLAYYKSSAAKFETRAARVALVLYGLFLLNGAVFSYGPRVLAGLWQSSQRDYDQAFVRLTCRIRPGDQVWGSATAWYAVVRFGGRLDAQPESVPAGWLPNAAPDPAVHHLVVTEHERNNNWPGYIKVDEIRMDMPKVMGSTLTSEPYLFDILESTTNK
jgi:4-amino-4-deoxy-L-arabinose transferase-like glycosyltransferase